MDNDTAKKAFEQLQATFDRLVMDLHSSSFMLMCSKDGWYQFKHYNTRNYLFLNIEGGQLHIPCENKPFMKGEF